MTNDLDLASPRPLGTRRIIPTNSGKVVLLHMVSLARKALADQDNLMDYISAMAELMLQLAPEQRRTIARTILARPIKVLQVKEDGVVKYYAPRWDEGDKRFGVFAFSPR